MKWGPLGANLGSQVVRRRLRIGDIGEGEESWALSSAGGGEGEGERFFLGAEIGMGGGEGLRLGGIALWPEGAARLGLTRRELRIGDVGDPEEYDRPLLDFSENQLTGAIPPASGQFFSQASFARNFFTKGGCTTTVPKKHYTGGNCLLKSKCARKQRTLKACTAFCACISPKGACGGHGVCSLSGPKGSPKCSCFTGFASPPSKPATCAKK